MTWKQNPDGSYTNTEFPLKALRESGIAKFLFLEGIAGRKIPIDDLWNNPLDPIPTAQELEVEIYQEQFPSGTQGGSAGAGAYNVRQINTQKIGYPWAGAPSGSEFVLSDNGFYGQYLILFFAPAYVTDYTVNVLRDITNGSAYYSTPSYLRAVNSAYGLPVGFAYVSLNSPATFRLETYTVSAQIGNGLGVPVGLPGVPETYAQIAILKVG